MRAFRFLAIMILVILILPWGAYAGKFAAVAQPQPEMAVAAVAHDGDVAAPQPPAGDKARVASTPTRCRTAILSGSTCGTDVVLATALITPQIAFSRQNAHPIADTRRDGLVSATDPDPPRSC